MKTMLQRLQSVAPMVATAIKNGHNVAMDFDASGIQINHWHGNKTEQMSIRNNWTPDCIEAEQDREELEIMQYLINLNK